MQTKDVGHPVRRGGPLLSQDAPQDWRKPDKIFADCLSIYVHIPFCNTLCTYCAFNTYAGLDNLVEPYVQALEREIALVARSAQGAGGPVSHTLYFGGGTPSLLTTRQVARIVAACRDHLGLTHNAEVTLEANPGSVDSDKLAGLRAAGVNRLSMGVQSAHAAELKLFGRRHTIGDAAEAFRLARYAGFDNINVDLIYGAPYQSRRSWRESVDAVLEWGPRHLSLYSLSLEPGTSLHRRVHDNRLPAPDGDLAADMYEDARQRLADAGYRHYELSNWARPGYECLHNLQYWCNEPFLGLGAGAHGAAADLRYWNVRPVQEYIERVSGAADNSSQSDRRFPLSPGFEDYEVIGERLAMAETVILGLRLVSEGLSRAGFAQRFRRDVDAVYGSQIEKLLEAGLLTSDGDAIHLSERAHLVSNRVFVQFLPDDA